TNTPPINIIREDTAVSSVSRPDNSLRQLMASTRNGSSSCRTRSACVKVKSRCSGSGVSSFSSSSSSSAIANPFLFLALTADCRFACPTFDAIAKQIDGRARALFGPLFLSADEHHGARRRHKIWRIDPVPFFFVHHHGSDVCRQILIRGTFPQQ